MIDLPTIAPGCTDWPGRGLFWCDAPTYHKIKAVSQSRIKLCRSSMEDFAKGHGDDDTEAMRYGRGFHCWYLEGAAAFARQFVIMPASCGAKEADKQTWIDYAASLAPGPEWEGVTPKSVKEEREAAFIAACARLGRDVVNAEWLVQMGRMIENAGQNPNIAGIMAGEGLNEVCLFDVWQVPGCAPIRVKARMDRVKVYADRVIGLDPKTLPEIGPHRIIGYDDKGEPVKEYRKLNKYVLDYDLHIQAVWYERIWKGLADVHGMPEILLMTFAGLEKKAPNGAVWFTPKAERMTEAREEIDEYLLQIDECRRAKRWPGLPTDLLVAG